MTMKHEQDSKPPTIPPLPPAHWLGRIVKRKAGSCRFSPYYKLEWFDNSLCVWRPLQKSFPTIEQAVAGKSPSRKWRVFKVSETGREIV